MQVLPRCSGGRAVSASGAMVWGAMHQQLSAGCPAAIAQRFACPHRGQTDAAAASAALNEREVIGRWGALRGRHARECQHVVSQCTAQAQAPMRSRPAWAASDRGRFPQACDISVDRLGFRAVRSRGGEGSFKQK
ncbi:hypothetical protein ASE39_16145 [Acidovorax sp. Root267]|nr:hypothetical protein ASE39_16145 [Acidovorax sp. Root267]